MIEPRHYSVDPNKWLSGVVVTTADVREAETAISRTQLDRKIDINAQAIVEAFGGQWRPNLTRETTHLLCMRADDTITSKYRKGLNAVKIGMKVVLPHWCVRRPRVS